MKSLRRDRDSNPGNLSVQRFSRPPQSTTLPPLQHFNNSFSFKNAAKVGIIFQPPNFIYTFFTTPHELRNVANRHDSSYAPHRDAHTHRVQSGLRSRSTPAPSTLLPYSVHAVAFHPESSPKRWHRTLAYTPLPAQHFRPGNAHMEQDIASGNRQKTHACRFAAEKAQKALQEWPSGIIFVPITCLY